MREINFRAFDRNKNEWFYFSLRPFFYQVYGKADAISEIFINVFDGKNIDPETITQYTGLKDKNGVEIYEGDVLNYAEPRNPYHNRNQKIEVVFGEAERYENGTIPYEGFVGFSFINHTKGFSTVFDESDIEVIGNVYENPSLLSGEEE